ncbi:DNA-binding response regulator [Paenibacillus sp. IB182496]|uniref:DNA-binding response regulator n=2 Tax=Paenibacillus sabuli TaxID=2772509 RepID=A0A927BNR2_9BACL|nr:DNA-binding response regulator [Paenibacillus sabuli]
MGARDYLVKPVEQQELLRVVRAVLEEKEAIGKRSLERTRRQQDEETGADRRGALLLELVTEENLDRQDYADLIEELGDRQAGDCFGVLSVRLDLSSGGFSSREVRLQDRKLLKYATVNIMEESLKAWNGLTFHGFGNELVGIIRLSPQEAAGERAEIQSRLHLIGQTICTNVKQYLNVEATVGMSTLHADVLMLPRLMEQAGAAAQWRELHPGQQVFYYSDVAAREHRGIAEWMTRVDAYVEHLKLHPEDPQPERIARPLAELGQTDELLSSCFGMLVYRIYAQLLGSAQDSGAELHRFDPDAYFRGLSPAERVKRLHEYISEAAELLRSLGQARDESILARITGYIRGHYRNPALKIQDIAGEVHFSTAHLGYLFKRETGHNLWDYVTELRIEEAKHLLRTTDQKRYEIAYAVGYESPEHFSRMFKRYVGVSPADYRKERGGSA